MPSPPRQVLVRPITWESGGVLSLELVDPAAALPGWEPGAHLDLHAGGYVRQYSLCGNPADWPPGSLKVERFAPRELTAEEAADRAARDGDFELVLGRSGQQFEVPVGCSILEVLDKNGIYPDSSCLEGTCGTCETAVLEGVPDHRDSILDEEDRAANETMMICVSRARSSRLVLDL